MAAAITMIFSTAEAMPEIGTLEILQATAGLEVQISPVYTTTSGGTIASDTVGPSTAAFRAAARLSAAAVQSSLGVQSKSLGCDWFVAKHPIGPYRRRRRTASPS